MSLDLDEDPQSKSAKDGPMFSGERKVCPCELSSTNGDVSVSDEDCCKEEQNKMLKSSEGVPSNEVGCHYCFISFPGG